MVLNEKILKLIKLTNYKLMVILITVFMQYIISKFTIYYYSFTFMHLYNL